MNLSWVMNLKTCAQSTDSDMPTESGVPVQLFLFPGAIKIKGHRRDTKKNMHNHAFLFFHGLRQCKR